MSIGAAEPAADCATPGLALDNCIDWTSDMLSEIAPDRGAATLGVKLKLAEALAVSECADTAALEAFAGCATWSLSATSSAIAEAESAAARASAGSGSERANARAWFASAARNGEHCSTATRQFLLSCCPSSVNAPRTCTR